MDLRLDFALHGSCLSPQRPEHLFDATLFLFHIGVDVEIEGGADIGMTEEGADGLVVTAAFDATGREAMSQAMKLHLGHIEFIEEFPIVVAVCARLGRMLGICKNI